MSHTKPGKNSSSNNNNSNNTKATVAEFHSRNTENVKLHLMKVSKQASSSCQATSVAKRRTKRGRAERGGTRSSLPDSIGRVRRRGPPSSSGVISREK